jgi:hypothetical protein
MPESIPESFSEPRNEKTVPLGFLAATVWTFGSAIYFGMVYVVTTYSYRWNVIFGLFCSLTLMMAGLTFVGFGYQFIRESQADGKQKRVLIPLIERFAQRGIELNPVETKKFEISYFVPIVVLFLTSWASMAYGFAKLNPGAYAHPERLSFWLMFKHYLWQVVDMIPLVEAWKHIHIEDPILENSLWPGVLVILFRLVILLVVLSAAAKLFGFEKRKKSQE